jgi:hypothetical protein
VAPDAQVLGLDRVPHHLALDRRIGVRTLGQQLDQLAMSANPSAARLSGCVRWAREPGLEGPRQVSGCSVADAGRHSDPSHVS